MTIKGADGRAQPNELSALQGSRLSANDPAELNPDVLLDLSLVVSMEVGRTRIPIRSLLSLAPGSVIPLERKAGEPFSVYANGKLIALGEVMVTNERMNARFTDTIGIADRLKAMP